MRLAVLILVTLLIALLGTGCSRQSPPPAATDFVLRNENDLIEAWGEPEDRRWAEDGMEVLLYLEEVQLDHAPDIITSSTYVPAQGGSIRTGPITSIQTWEGTQYTTEHRFWVNELGIIIRCESRLR